MPRSHEIERPFQRCLKAFPIYFRVRSDFLERHVPGILVPRRPVQGSHEAYHVFLEVGNDFLEKLVLRRRIPRRLVSKHIILFENGK